MYSKIIVYCSAFSFYHNSESMEIGSFLGGFPTFRIYGTGGLLGVDLWAFSLIVFWFFTSGSDALGYCFMFLLVLLPVTTFILSLLVGKNDLGGRRKWLICIAFGIMYMLAEYATFRAANMAVLGRFLPPSFGMLPAGAVLSLLGLGIGSGLRRLAARRK